MKVPANVNPKKAANVKLALQSLKIGESSTKYAIRILSLSLK